MRSNLLSLLVGILSFLGCKESSTYDKLVQNEMSSGVVIDSLLFNLKLGDTKKDFFDKCMMLNKKGIVTEGIDSYVRYSLPVTKKDSLPPKITMLFYGVFDSQDIMTGLDVRFYYEGWSLWNQKLQSDKLLPIVKDSLQSWFPGNEFIAIDSKKVKDDLFVKVDGNRQIVIEPIEDAKEVNVRIEDLRYLMN